MANYILTNKAVDDLSEIWDYTVDTWSEKQADFYYQMLLDNCGEIAENPAIGRNYEGIVKLIYGHKAGRHIIFYRKLSINKVEITRILHEQRDLKTRIKE